MLLRDREDHFYKIMTISLCLIKSAMYTYLTSSMNNLTMAFSKVPTRFKELSVAN